MNKITSNRLYNLDYLRGLSAFGIMIYHYLSWTFGIFEAETFIGRIGVYGVSIFYVLSGLTLFYVYYNKMNFSLRELSAFAKKRILRIFPLLWLVTMIVVIFSRKSPNLYDLFLNLTGLFGFVKWDTYFSTGVWSIGNELVFYTFFPFFVLFARSLKPAMIILSVFIFSLYLYFAFVKLDSDVNLANQWTSYVNPLNQVFLFLGGFLIGLFFQHIKIKKGLNVVLLLLGVGLFVFYPASGDAIVLVTGLNRLIFTTSCFMICFSFFKLTFKLPGYVHKPLILLGEASYSLYLLHPIVYKLMELVSKHVINLSEPVRLTTSVILTFIASYITYRYFEIFFMKLGRKSRYDLDRYEKVLERREVLHVEEKQMQ